MASSSTCALDFEVRAPHTRLTSGDLIQHGEAYVWSGVCAVGLTISVVGACHQRLRCSDVCSARSVLSFSGPSQGWIYACRSGGPTLHMPTQ